MSVVGQPLPSQDFCGTAALPLKPDIAQRGWNGRKVPKPIVSSCSKATSLLDHLVGAQQQRGGQLNADRLRGLEIDDQLVFDRLLDR